MGLVPILAVGVVFATLGVRLVRIASRSGGPERWLGAFFLAAGVALPLRAGVAMGTDFGLEPGLVNVLGQLVLSLGLVALAHFVRRVFRPETPWARHAFAAVCALAALQLTLFVASGAARDQASAVHIVVSSCTVAVFAWAFGESLLYWRAMRRRLALGLADPVVANRFGLFTLWTGAVVFFPVIVLGLRIVVYLAGSVAGDASASVEARHAWALGVVRVLAAVVGPTVAVALWLSFTPPARYLAWIRGGDASLRRA